MSKKTTLLLAPVMAPLTGSSPLGCATRDLARALQERGWNVTVAIGFDGNDEEIAAGVRRAGLARRLAPLEIGGQNLSVSEGNSGDIGVIALAYDGSPDPALSLRAALELGTAPTLLQLWTETASALGVSGDLKTIVHHSDASTAEGLDAADLVLLSSRTAAKAALKAKDSPFASMAERLRGLAPGYDAREWSPERDSLLSQRMDPPTAAGKAEAKAALRAELGLPDADVPLIGVISKITKLSRSDGAELIKMPLQIAGLGAGPHIEAMANRAPGVAACPKPLSDFESRQLRHRIVAAADFILMSPASSPLSLLYPCRYGTALIAHNSGEPGERIVNFDINSKTGSGFLYRSDDALLATIRAALHAWQEGAETREALVERCRALDLSWQTAAMRFDELVAPLL